MTREEYDQETLVKAVVEYRDGASSNELATKYEIPSSTIRNHKSNPNMRIGSGRPTLLTNHEERYFVELLKNLESIGVRLTKPVVRNLSSDYIHRISGE
jgi:transposase